MNSANALTAFSSIAQTAGDVLRILRETPETEARAVGRSARKRGLGEHTAAHRAAELEQLNESGAMPRLEGVSS